MKKNVLVFPCGSEIGLEVYNSVKNSLHFELYGLSSVSDHGKFVYKNYIEGIGFYDDLDFFDKLKEIIVKYNIDILYPTMDSVITKIKSYEFDLGVYIVGPSAHIANICESKRDTYNLLMDHIRVPKLFTKDDSLIYPIFIKPNIGYGSRNVLKVVRKEQLINIDLEENILCEYLPGQEYTIDCFTGLNRDLLFVGARERSRTMNGISVNTKTSVVLTNEFKSIAMKINEIIPFVGAWFFQLKKDLNGIPCLLEVACRFAGSSSVHRIQGVNFALSNLFITIGVEPVFIINEIEIELDRSLNSTYKINLEYDTIFIDYDDTIICDEKVNPDAIQFIFEAHNKHKKVYLITKHKGNLNKSLEKYRLKNLFDGILHLKEEEEKASYIVKNNYEKAIFIDDSFSEREKVFLKLNIPTFSIDCINSLINN